MTLVAAQICKDGTVWMGADSLSGTYTGEKRMRKDTKIFTSGPYLIGFTSSYRMGQILRHKTTLPKLLPKLAAHATSGHKHIVKVIDSLSESLFENNYTVEKDNRRYGGEFIISWSGRLYIVESDFQYHMPLTPYCCIGAGEAYGLGAMHASNKSHTPEESILHALRAASEFSCFVAPPFIIRNTAGYKKTYKK